MSTRSTTTTTKAPRAKKTATSESAKYRLAGPKPHKASKAAETNRAGKPASRSKVPAPSDVPPMMSATAKVADEKRAGSELKKRELIEMVVERSDIKKKYAKPVVEAMLDILGETVANGREMNLSPLGRIKYNRTKDTPQARVVVTKIRQNKSAGSAAPKPAADKIIDAAE